jgi:hypothetical protein
VHKNIHITILRKVRPVHKYMYLTFFVGCVSVSTAQPIAKATPLPAPSEDRLHLPIQDREFFKREIIVASENPGPTPTPTPTPTPPPCGCFGQEAGEAGYVSCGDGCTSAPCAVNDPDFSEREKACIIKHEEVHIKDPASFCLDGEGHTTTDNKANAECTAHKAHLECLLAIPNPTEHELQEIQNVYRDGKAFCDEAGKPPPPEVTPTPTPSI